MKLRQLVLAVATLTALVSTAQAGNPVFNTRASYVAQSYSWQRGYYDPAWGVPYAQVVPRRANLQTKYAWGVTGTQMTPIYNQYTRTPKAMVGGYGEVYAPTPAWPSHTDQFGGYYVRTPRH